ncbi:MAG: pentapeptide repeat-containing protein [Enterobacteriaceae bacterium]
MPGINTIRKLFGLSRAAVAQHDMPPPLQSTDPHVHALRELLKKEPAWYRRHHTDEKTFFSGIVKEILDKVDATGDELRISLDDKFLCFKKEADETGELLHISFDENSCGMPISLRQLSVYLALDRVRHGADYGLTQSENSELLVGQDFYDTDLTDFDLSHLNLAGVNLSKVKLDGVNLQGANLQGANLQGLDLQGMNLQGVKIQNAKLQNANLQSLNLQGINMMGCNLSGADLTRANLTGCFLFQSWMIKTNLTGAILDDCNISSSHLAGANLTGASLRKTNMRASDLSNSILAEVDLTQTYLTSASLKGVDMRDSRLKLSGNKFGKVDLAGVDLTGADIILDLPQNWHQGSLDNFFNPEGHPERSLLYTLSTIDKSLLPLKMKLLSQLVTSLNGVDPDTLRLFTHYFETFLTHEYLSLPLSEVSGDPDSETVQNFLLYYVLEPLIAKANSEVWLSQNPHIYPFLLALAGAEGDSFMLNTNNFFMQLIVNSLASADVNVQEQAKALYEKYLRLPEIEAWRQAALIIFGDLEGSADWTDNTLNNIILRSGENAMLLSVRQFNQMCQAREDTDWFLFSIYHRDANGMISEQVASPDALCGPFSLFKARYQFAQNRDCFPRLLSKLNLDDELSALFHEEIKRRAQDDTYKHKLTRPEEKKKLARCFDPILDRSADTDTGMRLVPDHLTDILSSYNLQTASDQVKAQTLLSLAAIFAKYSSSHHFGTETDSPDTLRFYAYALMHEARLLDSEAKVLSSEQITEWGNKLLGIGEAFTCTAILSDIMTGHAKRTFPDIINGIIPPAWS